MFVCLLFYKSETVNKGFCIVYVNRQNLQKMKDIDFVFSLITCFVELGECWNNYMARHNIGNGFALLKTITLLFIQNKYVTQNKYKDTNCVFICNYFLNTKS
jgi:hypothetical protein